MTRHTIPFTAMILCVAHAAAAQLPPRTPAEPSRSVTLSLAEYNRLIDRASQTIPAPAPPPVAAVLSNAELLVRVDGATARGAFALAGDVLRPGLNTVKLLSGGTVLNASAAGRPLPLVVDGRAHAAILPGPGPFTVDVEWGTPLVMRPGRAQFSLPVPAAGTAHARIDVPGDQADVHVNPGWITRRSTDNGRTIVEATLDPGTTAEVWWSMRDSAPVAAAREVRTVADVLTLLTLGESDVRMVALIDLTVVAGRAAHPAVSVAGWLRVERHLGQRARDQRSARWRCRSDPGRSGAAPPPVSRHPGAWPHGRILCVRHRLWSPSKAPSASAAKWRSKAPGHSISASTSAPACSGSTSGN